MTERLKAYLGLGSNLGDRLHYLQQARQRLGSLPGVELIGSSKLYRSDALGGPSGQPEYLNAVITLQTLLDPETLLVHCLEIERQLGRTRKERWGARTLDIDLLLVGTLQVETEALILPHPRLHERSFVLLPLRDLDPDLVHPGNGLTVAQLIRQLGAASCSTCLGSW